MKRRVFSMKFLMASTIVSVISIIFISTLSSRFSSSQTSHYKAANGLGICFQRVSQTFTALMIRDLKSQFMSSGFKLDTGECLSQISTELATLAAGINIKDSMNNLISDVHWFNEKISRIESMIETEDVNLYQSNIIKKFEQLESLKIDIEDSVLKSAQGIDEQKFFASIIMVLAQLAFVFSVFGIFLKKKFTSKAIEDVEELLVKNLETHTMDETVLAQKLINKTFNALELPKAQSFLTKFLNNTVEENYKLKDYLLKANTEGERFEISEIPELKDELEEQKTFETNNLNEQIDNVLKRIEQKAFNHGIIFDTKIEDKIFIKSFSEPLEQFLYYLISFSMDSSLEHNEGRKVIISAKLLGGVVYSKIKIAGHSFTDSEFAVINGREPDDSTNINLVLLKELIGDANARLAVKNKIQTDKKIVESEIEIIFERAIENKSESKLKVQKGTKKQILEMMKNPEITL